MNMNLFYIKILFLDKYLGKKLSYITYKITLASNRTFVAKVRRYTFLSPRGWTKSFRGYSSISICWKIWSLLSMEEMCHCSHLYKVSISLWQRVAEMPQITVYEILFVLCIFFRYFNFVWLWLSLYWKTFFFF